MDRDLMFSQRNNPYCDLLKISGAKVNFFCEIIQSVRVYLYICAEIVKNQIL